MEKSKDEDENFKRFLKYFVTESIFGYYSRTAEAETLSPEVLPKVESLINFLEGLNNLRAVVKDKPKNVLEAALQVYGDNDREDSLNRVSYFLHECPLIEGPKLTEALGGTEGTSSEELRKKFMHIMDFKDHGILHAMRSLFWGFYMTGETQVIERVMWQFSEEYIGQNSVSFQD